MDMKGTSSSINAKKYLLPVAVFTFIFFVFSLLSRYDILAVSSGVLLSMRLLILASLFLYALKKKSLTTWILISMVFGVEFGYDLPEIAVKMQVISKIFLSLVKTIIGPLLFATLVVGIAGHADLKQVGRMGLKSIIYFEVVSTIALFIGLLAINISKAGVGVVIPQGGMTSGIPEVKAQTGEEIILHIFPENIAKAVAEGNVLQIVVFSIIFGIAVALLKEQFRRPMLTFTQALSETMFKFTNIVMFFAPAAVFAAISASVGHMGIDILVNLAKLLGTLYVALIVFLLGILLPIALVLRIPIRQFISAVSEPFSIAFATTSSESALPRAMENMEKFGVPRKIVAFVIPTGYSFNLDGTTLYLSLATIFVAQVTNTPLTFAHQLAIVFTLMITSKGVAGVPRASLVILLGTAASFGLPTWPIFIILGIDELMDMARTGVNVIGNCLATVVVAKWEKEFDRDAALKFDPDEVDTLVEENQAVKKVFD
jgi:proton glutamate symport protein